MRYAAGNPVGSTSRRPLAGRRRKSCLAYGGWLMGGCLLACTLVGEVSATSWRSALDLQEYDSLAERPAPNMEQDVELKILRIPFIVAEETASRRADSMRLAQNMVPTASSIAVIYPDVGEPYRTIFMKIIEGIEDKAKMPVVGFPVGRNVDGQELAAKVRRSGIKLVIALGRDGFKAASALQRDASVLAAGVVSVAESDTQSAPIYSLAPDPSLLFARLKALMPGVRRVFVVYDPRQNNWLIRLARDAAKAHGLELAAQEAQDLKESVRLYQEIITTADAKKDALWLPQDSTTVEDSAILPLVLQGTWDRSITLFSSNASHVRRGVLFSLYPNNVEFGRSLAQIALAGNAPRGVIPLREVLAALNIRTANHLGLSLGYKQQQSFDLVFPEQ